MNKSRIAKKHLNRVLFKYCKSPRNERWVKKIWRASFLLRWMPYMKDFEETDWHCLKIDCFEIPLWRV